MSSEKKLQRAQAAESLTGLAAIPVFAGKPWQALQLAAVVKGDQNCHCRGGGERATSEGLFVGGNPPGTSPQSTRKRSRAPVLSEPKGLTATLPSHAKGFFAGSILGELREDQPTAQLTIPHLSFPRRKPSSPGARLFSLPFFTKHSSAARWPSFQLAFLSAAQVRDLLLPRGLATLLVTICRD